MAIDLKRPLTILETGGPLLLGLEVDSANLSLNSGPFDSIL